MADANARPLVSLVIAARAGGAALVACIESFVAVADDRFEIIVSRRGGDTDEIPARCPAVRVQRCDDRSSTPELRAAGLKLARGDIVAFTTDRCRADREWLRALRDAHAAGPAAVGGAIEYGGRMRGIDRAVFLCEYGRYTRPLAAGPSIDLPGQNVSYTRAALEAAADLIAVATWEPLWHWRMHERGLTLVCDPTRLVWMTRHFTLGGFLAERYHYSRAFAGQRFAGRAWPVRVLVAGGTVLLPALLLARVVRVMMSKRGRAREWLMALPYIALFTIPWAIGEFVGAIAGPGDSAARID